ncbi:MAG: BON domain-containing protein [Acidobacteriota bacterium]|nr:BON domain-containing protein [Acidobacteriota bacterium]
MKLILLVVTAVLSFAAATPSKPTAAKQKPAAAAPRINDAQIERAIRGRFAESKISTDNFSAHVQGGIATLTGHTGVIQHKGVATRLAKSSGALAVINNIEISQAAKDKAAKNLESGRRRAQLKRSETVARSEAR